MQTPSLNTAIFWIWLPDIMPTKYVANIEKTVANFEDCDFYCICNTELNHHLPQNVRLIALDEVRRRLHSSAFDATACIEFIDHHEDLMSKSLDDRKIMRCPEQARHYDYDTYVMLSDLLRVHASLLLHEQQYHNTLYLDADIDPGSSMINLSDWFPSTSTIKLSREESMIDFDILGVAQQAVGFLHRLQQHQAKMIAQPFRDANGFLNRALFNPIAKEIMIIPKQVDFIEKRRDCIVSSNDLSGVHANRFWKFPSHQARFPSHALAVSSEPAVVFS